MDVDPNSDLAGNAEEGGLDPLAVLPFFSKPVSRDFDEDLLNEPTPKIRLHGIEPAQGPITGKKLSSFNPNLIRRNARSSPWWSLHSLGERLP